VPQGVAFLYVQCTLEANKGGVYQVVPGCTVGNTYTISGSLKAPSGTSKSTVKCSLNAIGATYDSATLIRQVWGTTNANTWYSFSVDVVAGERAWCFGWMPRWEAEAAATWGFRQPCGDLQIRVPHAEVGNDEWHLGHQHSQLEGHCWVLLRVCGGRPGAV